MNKKENMPTINDSGIIDLSVASVGTETGKNKETWKFEKKHALDKCRGVFRYYDRPGQTLEFPLSKFGFPVRFFELKDKQEYILPRYVAVHLKESGEEVIQQWVMGPNGKPHKDAGTSKKRYDFDCPDLAHLDGERAPIIYSGVAIN